MNHLKLLLLFVGNLFGDFLSDFNDFEERQLKKEVFPYYYLFSFPFSYKKRNISSNKLSRFCDRSCRFLSPSPINNWKDIRELNDYLRLRFSYKAIEYSSDGGGLSIEIFSYTQMIFL
jgi:hypothetical protein